MEPTRGSLMVSADGRSVVILQNPVFGNSRGTGQLQLNGKINHNKNPEMIELVSFFREGKKMASYTWKDLIIRPQMVEESTSHTRWVYKMLPAKEPLGDILELETTSLRAYRFEVKTGKFLSADDSVDWKRCSIVAYGPIKSENNGYVMSPAHVAKGEKQDKIRLAEVKIPLNSSYVVACIESQQGKLVLTEVFPFMLNALTVK